MGKSTPHPAHTVHDLVVTLLYVPADRKDRVRKALGGDADVVIVDLEDAVAPSAKIGARAALPTLLEASPRRAVRVRINGMQSPWGQDDLAMVARLPPYVDLCVPKVESASEVREIAAEVGPDHRLHCLLESALGVQRAFDVAGSAPSVASIGLGEADLRSDLGVHDDQALAWSRGRVIVAARAAGLPPPAQSVYTRVRDSAGLEASTRAGRAQGFLGRCAIHPAQLPVIRAAYRPSAEETGRAHEVLRELEAAQDHGSGVFVLPNGEFIDAAMADGARRVVALERSTRP